MRACPVCKGTKQTVIQNIKNERTGGLSSSGAI